MSDYRAGYASAKREIRDDRWTPQCAKRYLEECAASGHELAFGRDEYDRGFMAAVRELAALSVPDGFREGHDGALACPHRDVSCCDACASAHVEIVEVYGAHFWVAEPKEREKLREETREVKP